ncbi:MAG: hypothetical protein ABJM06_04935 [Gilvibacter sp.]
MKQLILVLVGALLVASCSSESPSETVLETQFTVKTAATHSNFGTYYGTFTSVDNRYNGTVEIVVKPSLEGMATLKLNGEKSIELSAYSEYFTDDEYSELLFRNDEVTFVFSVEGNGINPLVQNCIINDVVTTMLIKE